MAIHFQADFPNQRTLTIREVEEIQATTEENSEEKFEEEDQFGHCKCWGNYQ